MKNDFSNAASSSEIEISPQELCQLTARQCYVPLTPELGIQTEDYERATELGDANYARDYPFGRLFDLPKEVPEDLHHGAVITQALTGYPADYLIQKAYNESSFRAEVESSSGAVGYQQFKDESALEALYRLKTHPAADKIKEFVPEIEQVERRVDQDYRESFVVADPAQKESVLHQTRTDPIKSSLMAAAYNQHYINSLQDHIPQQDMTEIHGYAVHFFGYSQARNFFQKMQEDPNAPAYTMYDRGIHDPVVRNQTNRNIFFENGDMNEPRSFEEVSEFFAENKNLSDFPLYTKDEGWPSAEGIEILQGEAARQRMQQTHPDGIEFKGPDPIEEPMDLEQLGR